MNSFIFGSRSASGEVVAWVSVGARRARAGRARAKWRIIGPTRPALVILGPVGEREHGEAQTKRLCPHPEPFTHQFLSPVGQNLQVNVRSANEHHPD